MRGSAVQALAVLQLGCSGRVPESDQSSRGPGIVPYDVYSVLTVHNVGILHSSYVGAIVSIFNICLLCSVSERIPSALPLALSTSRNADARVLSIQLSDRFSRLVFELLYSPPLNWAWDSFPCDRDNIDFSSFCEDL